MSARIAMFVLLFFAAGCPKKTVVEDAGPAPSPAASVSPPSSASAAPEVTIALPPPPRELELVAAGKGVGSKIVWLIGLGDRVWLSGAGVDAYADGDGPLVKGPDLLKGIPYEAGKNTIEVIGRYPRLFALRTRNPEGRAQVSEPVLFTFDDGQWKQAKPLADLEPPRAFVPWGEGALLVWSQIHYHAWAAYDPSKPGTKFVHLASDGTLSEPKLAIEPTFLAFGGDSDGKTLSLLGAVGKPMKGSTEVALVRGTKDGLGAPIVVSSGMQVIGSTYSARVIEDGRAPLVLPVANREVLVTKGWKPDTRTVSVVGKEVSTLVAVPNPNCDTTTGILYGDAVYAIQSCGYDVDGLYRTEPAGKPTRVPLPSLAKKEGGGWKAVSEGTKGAGKCYPRKLLLRGKADLWIHADCGTARYYEDSFPVVFRAGKPQEAIVLP